jgi:hypothetical protein
MAHTHITQRFTLTTLNEEKTILLWCCTSQIFIVLISPFTIQYIHNILGIPKIENPDPYKKC